MPMWPVALAVVLFCTAVFVIVITVIVNDL